MKKKEYMAPTTEQIQVNVPSPLLIVSGTGVPDITGTDIIYDGADGFFDEGEIIASNGWKWL